MFYVYIVASESGTLYIGVTNDLKRRIFEHREKLIDGFTKKYDCKKLIYFELTESIAAAIRREKQLKNWNREKKEHLIMGLNPTWKDLFESL